MSNRLIVVVTGLPGTGKSMVGNYLQAHHNFTIFESSSQIRSHALENGVELKERVSYGEYSRHMQENLHLPTIAEILISSGIGRCALVGARSPRQIELIQKNRGLIIGLECPAEICVSRSPTNSPKVATTVEEYIEALSAESSSGLHGTATAQCVSMADVIIDTSQHKDDVLRDVDNAINDYAIEKNPNINAYLTQQI